MAKMLLSGTWRLVSSRAWDACGAELPAPYGEMPLGHIGFANGRMLAALCAGDGSNYSSYGGPFEFDGSTLRTTVDMASDSSRIGSIQVRGVRADEDGRLVLSPPRRSYGGVVQRRELCWEQLVPAAS